MKRLLGRLWNIWLPVGQFIGDWIARIVLTLFYFTILLPYGIGVRLLSDPLGIKKPLNVSWSERKTVEPSLEKYRSLG